MSDGDLPGPVDGNEPVEPGWSPVVVFGVVVVLLLVGVAVVTVVDRRGDDGGATASGSVDGGAPVTSTTAVRSGSSAAPTTVPTPGRASLTYEAACEDELRFSVAPPVEDPNLVEVSGIAVDARGVNWVLNDSGDRPRIYGVGRDGSVQTVDVVGADAVDWEDIAIQRTAEGEVLWIADTGSNIEPRPVVQLYRVAVPEPSTTEVVPERFNVTYPDGSHDVEAVLVEPSGTVVLITKDPGTPAVYRVDPGAGSTLTAQLLGTFSVGNGERTVVTSADLAGDGSTVVLRTYGSVFLVPIDEDQELIDALSARDRHCRGIPPLELQGEAIAFVPDGSGYVSMGEGRNPYLTTVSVPG